MDMQFDQLKFIEENRISGKKVHRYFIFKTFLKHH